MKKYLLILPFLAFLTLNTSAQGIKNFRFGLVFSNAVLFPASDNVAIKSKPSYDFDYGLSIDYFFTDNYALSTGVYMDHPILVRNNGIATFADSSFLANSFWTDKNVNASTIGNKEKITAMNLNTEILFLDLDLKHT